jgi:hypothetical protein
MLFSSQSGKFCEVTCVVRERFVTLGNQTLFFATTYFQKWMPLLPWEL